MLNTTEPIKTNLPLFIGLCVFELFKQPLKEINNYKKKEIELVKK